jgi:hypothetical protein
VFEARRHPKSLLLVAQVAAVAGVLVLWQLLFLLSAQRGGLLSLLLLAEPLPFVSFPLVV